MCDKCVEQIMKNELAMHVANIINAHTPQWCFKVTDDGVVVFNYRKGLKDFPAIKVEGKKIICPAGTNLDLQMDLITAGM